MAIYDTQASLRTWLLAQLPTGVGGARQTTIANGAIQDAVGYLGTQWREVARADCVGDGELTRFAVPGVDCRLLDEAYWETPVNLGTCTTLNPPTAAPTAVVATTGGSLTPGVYHLAYAYGALVGSTTLLTNRAPPLKVVVPAGTNTNVITLTFPAPSRTLEPLAGTLVYISTTPGRPDMHSVSFVAAPGTSLAISLLPAASGPMPLVDFVTLRSLNPIPLLEQDRDIDGSATTGKATLMVQTAPALYAMFRVNYDRKPAIPEQDGDTISIEQGAIRTAALAFAAKAFAYNQEAGDTTALLDLYLRQDALLMDIMRKPTLWPRMRPRVPAPSS